MKKKGKGKRMPGKGRVSKGKSSPGKREGFDSKTGKGKGKLGYRAQKKLTRKAAARKAKREKAVKKDKVKKGAKKSTLQELRHGKNAEVRGKQTQAQQLLDTAIRRGKKEAGTMAQQKDRGKAEKDREARKIKVSAEYLRERVRKDARRVPDLSEMHAFHKELLDTFISAGDLKKACAQLEDIAGIVRKLRMEYTKRVYAGTPKESHKASSAFFGRVASVLKSAEKNFVLLEKFEKLRRELPKVDFEAKSVIIAGYPNTGKSTILRRLTGSAPEAAEYPFTTKGLMVGMFEGKYVKYQLIDTPGLLDRPLEKRSEVEKRAALALKHLAKLVVFVVDPTMWCGFPIEKQVSLLKELKKEFKGLEFLVVINKSDVATEDELDRARGAFEEVVKEELIIEGEGEESMLKEFLVGKLSST